MLDNTDIKILKELTKNGRLSFAELSDRINLSQTPTLKRVRRLEEDGYIKGYKAILDEAKLGGRMTIFTNVSLGNQKRKTLKDFERLIRISPEVMDCFLMSGECDYLLRIVVNDLQEFEHFLIDKVSRLVDITNIRSSFALRPVICKSTPPDIA